MTSPTRHGAVPWREVSKEQAAGPIRYGLAVESSLPGSKGARIAKYEVCVRQPAEGSSRNHR